MDEQDRKQVTFSLESIVVIEDNQYTADLDSDVAILDYTSGKYYGLSTAGARIWKLIEQPRKVEQVLNTLLEEYDVERDKCQQDLLALLQKLISRGLIKIVPDIPTSNSL